MQIKKRKFSTIRLENSKQYMMLADVGVMLPIGRIIEYYVNQ
jgi:hypothetical protein